MEPLSDAELDALENANRPPSYAIFKRLIAEIRRGRTRFEPVHRTPNVAPLLAHMDALELDPKWTCVGCLQPFEGKAAAELRCYRVPAREGGTVEGCQALVRACARCLARWPQPPGTNAKMIEMIRQHRMCCPAIPRR